MANLFNEHLLLEKKILKIEFNNRNGKNGGGLQHVERVDTHMTPLIVNLLLYNDNKTFYKKI